MRAEIAELDMWVCNHRHYTEMATQITATFDQGHLEVTCNKIFEKQYFICDVLHFIMCMSECKSEK